MRLCVIFNPAAKGGKARRFRRDLIKLAANAVFKPTTGPGAARQLATEAVNEGYRTVVAVGGDGTVNEVLNGIADSPGGLERTALGVIPLGTANVLARELHLPFSPTAAWNVLHANRRTRVDAFRATYQHQGRSLSRLGVQLAGAGLDARAVELVDWPLKQRAGYLAYVLAGLRALTETHPIITSRADASTHQGELVLLGNGRLYGGSFAVFPHASLRDGCLDVRVFPRAGWATALSFGLGILANRLEHCGESTNLRTPTLSLTASRRVPLQLDGELVGELPATFEILPAALEVIIP